MLRSNRASRLSGFLRALWNEYQRDELMDVAATLTFYVFLAVFPFLLFLVTIASRLLTSEMTQGLLHELARVAPEPVLPMVAARLRALQHGSGVGLLTLSLLTAIWSSMAAVVSLMTALNRAYGLKEERSFWTVHGIALLTTFILGGLVLAAAGSTVGSPLIASALGGRLGVVFSWFQFPFAGLLMILALAVTYRLLPSAHPQPYVIAPGALIAVVLWLLTSWGFSAYIRNLGTYELVYGALGGVVVLLLWMWLTGQVILVGAEINKLLTRGRGTRPHAPSGDYGQPEGARGSPPPSGTRNERMLAIRTGDGAAGALRRTSDRPRLPPA